MDITKAARRIQQLADLIEKLVKQSNELRERIMGLEDTVEDTNDRVEQLERQIERQNALVEAVAEAEGVDVESITAELEAQRAVEEIDEDVEAGSGDADADPATGTDA